MNAIATICLLTTNRSCHAPKPFPSTRLCTAYILGMLLLPMFGSSAAALEQLTVEIREPAGIGRGGYPVGGLLELPRAVPSTTPFRLLYDSKPVVAQFRPDQATGASSKWWIDFTTNLNPFERRVYTVEFGADLDPGPQRKRGHVLVQRDDAFVISNAPYINWTIPRDLTGLLRSVDFPPSEHLRPDSPGLMLRDSGGNEYPMGGSGTTVKIVRQGPVAIALRFEKQEIREPLAGVAWTVDLLFPVPVSWVEVVANVRDPQSRVTAVGMQLHMNLDQPTASAPTLVDLGAAGTVYTSLVGDQQIELQARSTPSAARPWEVLRTQSGRLQPFVLAPQRNAVPAEGWSHVMDRKRCLALAVGGFAQAGEESINASAGGLVTVWRSFPPEADSKERTAKSLRMWLHFVHYPPQYSAGASPQAMQHPIEIRVIDRR